MKIIMTYYCFPIAMNANYVLYSEIGATKTFMKYWQQIWWKSSISQYIDIVRWNQYQPLTNSAKQAKICWIHIAVY